LARGFVAVSVATITSFSGVLIETDTNLMDNHKVLGEKIADASNLADEFGIDLHPRDAMPELQPVS